MIRQSRQKVALGSLSERHPQDRQRLEYWDEALVFRHAESPVAVRRIRQTAIVLHGHAFTELVLIVAGSSTQQLDEQFHTLGAGDWFVVGKQHRHAYLQPHGLQLINVLIRDGFLRRHAEALSKLAGWRKLSGPEFYRPRALNVDELAMCLRLIERIEGEAVTMQDGFSQMQEALLLELLVTLSRLCEERATAAAVARSRIGEVLDYMQAHLAAPLALEELERRAGMSARSFLRHFRQTTGISPGQYLQRLRILHACRLLQTTELRIKEVGASCGMSDPAYFCRTFRRHVGRSPGKFRR